MLTGRSSLTIEEQEDTDERFGQKKPGGRRRAGRRWTALSPGPRQALDERMKGYREQSLRNSSWVCARCGREFTVKNLHLLTVHHRDHNHENNLPTAATGKPLPLLPR